LASPAEEDAPPLAEEAPDAAAEPPLEAEALCDEAAPLLALVL
jgi:hypothetical protein